MQNDTPVFVCFGSRWSIASTLIPWAFIIPGSFATEQEARNEYARRATLANEAGLQVGQR